MRYALILLILLFLFPTQTSVAVEVAPRISDREIVERLTILEEGQKAILREIDKRFEAIDKRFDDLRKDMNTRFESVDKRFESIDKRFDDLRFFLRIILSLILALFGYMVWDRRTMMKPLETKVINLERELGLGDVDGSKIVRLINALRDLSKDDPKVARVLRQFHLL